MLTILVVDFINFELQQSLANKFNFDICLLRQQFNL
jgi:hypothetical protein